MQTAVQAEIPDDLDFSDLRLERGADGVSFDWEVIARICQASGIPTEVMREETQSATT